MARCTDPNHSFEHLKQWIINGNEFDIHDIMVEPLTVSAAIAGHTQCLQLLLDSGAHIDASDYSGESALYCASEYGQYDCVMLLLKNGALTKRGSIVLQLWILLL